MSASDQARSAQAIALSRQRRKGLRVAIAVSLGLTTSVASGAIVPFLASLFAAQFLLSSSSPLPFGRTLGIAIIFLVAGIFFMSLAALFSDKPTIFLLLLGLIYFALFFVQAMGKGGAAIFLILIIATMVPLLFILNQELAGSILSILVTGAVGGTILMWVAHAVIPEPLAEVAAPPPVVRAPHPYRRALANSLILLIAVTTCLTNSQLASAVVIPVTVASLLGQLDIVRSGRAAFGLLIVNLFGGVVASFAYAVLSLRPSLFSMAIITLIVALLLGGRAASDAKDGAVYAGGLTTFLILFGLGVSPLPGSAAESFTTRIVYVAGAIAFTFILAALLWPRQDEVGRTAGN